MSSRTLQLRNLIERVARYWFWLVTGSVTVCYWVVLAYQPFDVQGIVPNQPSRATIYSPRALTYESEVSTNLARENAASAPELVIQRVDGEILDTGRSELVRILDQIDYIRTHGTTYAARKAQIDAIDERLDVALLDGAAAGYLTDLPNSEWVLFQSMVLAAYDQVVRTVDARIDDATAAQLAVIQVPTAVTSHSAVMTAKPAVAEELAVRLLLPFLKKNVSVDTVATAAARQKARAAVEPITVFIKQGETIVRSGDIVDDLRYEKLMVLGLLDTKTNWNRLAGQFLLALCLSLLLSYTLWRSEKRSERKPRELLAVTIVILAVVVVTRALATTSNLVLAAPIAMMAMIFSVLFGVRVASMMILNVALMLWLMTNGDSLTALPPVISAMVAAMMIRRNTRTLAFVVSGLAGAAASVVVLIAVTLLSAAGIEWRDLLVLMGITVVGSVLSALLAMSLYNYVGRMAGVITEQMLLGWAHPAEPLLRRLTREAPGTYAHSFSVGNLAENAAEAIEANALLLRIASLYHDIGKLGNPYYFVDNQHDGINPHDELPPEESALIIIGHVTDGIALAQEAGLPEALIDFIRTHHGTTQVRAFLNKAKASGEPVDVAAFTYPGPIPATKEQALLMLADSVEATVRSKIQSGALVPASDRSGYQFDELITSIIQDKLDSGQLANSPLTYAELTKVKAAFAATLKGIYHPRIDYSAKDKPAADPVVVPQGHV